MNRVAGPQMVVNTARRVPAEGSMILIPFPGTTVISSMQAARAPKQGK